MERKRGRCKSQVIMLNKNKLSMCALFAVVFILAFSCVSAESWSQSAPINVDYAGSQNLVDTLIYVNADTTRFSANNCNDFRVFSTITKSFVPFGISNCGTANTAIWFKSDLLSGFNGTLAYLYLGNNNAGVEQSSVSMWSSLNDMNHDRAGATAEVVNNQVYVFGGFSMLINGASASIEAFSPSSNIWTDIGALTEAKGWVTSINYGDEVAIVGGASDFGSSNMENIVQVFNVRSKATSIYKDYFPSSAFPTTNLNMLNYEQQDYVISSGALTTPTINRYYRLDSESWSRLEPSGFAVNENYTLVSQDGIAYMLGGGQGRTDLISLDVLTGEIRKLASMENKRYLAGAIIVGDYIYVFGGAKSGAGNATNTVERYSISQDAWETLESMPDARIWPAVANINDKLYVAGGLQISGQSATTLSSVFEFSIPNWNSQVTIGAATACSSEICDGLDNDCDGFVDKASSGSPLIQDCGECGGTQSCYNGNWSACTVANQTNATTQACYSGPNGTAGVGICKQGTKPCGAGLNATCTGEVTPAASENCTNGLDDNCDGAKDCLDDLCGNDTACKAVSKPTDVKPTQTTAVCGNNIKDIGEDCDGTSDSTCPGACTTDCNCPFTIGDGACDKLVGESNAISPDDCKKANYVPLFIVLGVLLSVFVLVYYLKPEWISSMETEVEELMGKKQEPSLPETEEKYVQKEQVIEPTREELALRSYILNSLKDGYDPDELKDSLIAIGWPSIMVNKVISEFEGVEPEAEAKPIQQIKMAPAAHPAIAKPKTIDDFIKIALASGQKMASIKATLLKAGWNENIVNRHIARFTSQK